KVIRSGAPIVVSDLTKEACYQPWLARARTFGIRSGLCLPLRCGEKTFGVLVLHRSEVYEMMPDELGRIQRLADDLAIGITLLRERDERAKHQETLKEQAALIDEASDAICVRDLSHRIMFWSKGAERLFGWTFVEVRGRQIDSVLEIDSDFFSRAEDDLLTHGKWSGEVRTTAKDGTPLILISRWTLLR